MRTLNFILTDKNEATATKKVCTLVNGEVQMKPSLVEVSKISAVRAFLMQQQQTLGSSSFMLAEVDIAQDTIIEIPTAEAVTGNDIALPCFYASRYKGPELDITLFNLECENIIKNVILAK